MKKFQSAQSKLGNVLQFVNFNPIFNYKKYLDLEFMTTIKDTYIFIDEAGTLAQDDDNKYFILSCYITDTPARIKTELYTLRTQIMDDPYNAFDIAKFDRQGFHACENHPDIRSAYYKVLLRLNIRIYSVVIDKKSDLFHDLMSKFNDIHKLYSFFVRQLLYDRILSEWQNRIHIVFEEYGSSITKHKSEMNNTVSIIIKELATNGLKSNVLFDVDVHSKEDILLSVVDYTNFVLFQMLKDIDPSKNTRMIANFKLIEPKIAILHSLHNAQYYNSKKSINFEEIKGRLEVK